MANTSRLKLRYPVGGDAPNVPLDLSKLAQDVDDSGVYVATRSVLDVGQSGQTRAGRALVAADFTTMLGLGTPGGVFNLGDLTNLGSGAALTNKGAVVFSTGIEGVASSAARFDGSTTAALYTADTGSNDVFRLTYGGSFGCWFKTARVGAPMHLMAKGGAASFAWRLYVHYPENSVAASISQDGSAWAAEAIGFRNVIDDRWHFAVGTYDGYVLRLYVDGQLEASVALSAGGGGLFASTTEFNIGAYGASGASNANQPMFGLIDESFVTQDILNEDQIRFLYAAKVAHGFVPGSLSRTVRKARCQVRRRRRGLALATTDFPVTPVRLHNLADLTDLGSGAAALTANAGTGTQVVVPGPDGQRSGAYHMFGSHNGLSASDTGLPSGTNVRSFGAWVRSVSPANTTIIGWGTYSTGHVLAGMDTNGYLKVEGGGVATITTNARIDDGLWHHVCVVEDNTAFDGLKRKVYCDGALVGTVLTIASITLAGANAFRVGATPTGTLPWVGMISRAFVAAAAFTPEQVRAVYQKSGLSLGISPVSVDVIERIDDTNLYIICDDIESQNQIDLEVAA